jgi:ParB family chromosome partitioning protein
MAKGKQQTADDLIKRYASETGSFEVAVAEPKAEPAPKDPLLDSLRRNLNRVVLVPLELLEITENVRRTVDLESPEFLSLVDSIKQNGIRQNIVVDLQEPQNSKFRLVVIAGQRRVLAGRVAGIKSVAALVLQLNDRGQRLAEGLAENLFREDLHCLDQAEAYAALVEEGWSETHIAETFERRRKTILQFLRLARYPEIAKSYIREHKDVFTAYLLFNKFIAKAWKTEAELISKLAEVVEGRQKTVKETPLSSSQTARLIRAVQNINGLKCKVSGDDETGKVAISYQNQAALEKMLSIFEGID